MDSAWVAGFGSASESGGVCIDGEDADCPGGAAEGEVGMFTLARHVTIGSGTDDGDRGVY